MSSDLGPNLAWPVARAGEALVALAHAAGLSPRAGELGEPAAELDAWLETAGAWLGVDVEAVATPCEALADALAVAAPALVRTPAGFIALVARGVALAPDLRRVRCSPRAIAEALVAPLRADLRLPSGMPADAREILLAARLRGRPVEGIVLLRRPPEAPARLHARDQRLGSAIAGVLALHALAQALWLGSWWAIGNSVLGGALSAGWLAAWALLLGGSQLARVVVDWWSGRLAITASGLLSQRLMAGALRLEPDALKRDGVGGALGRVLESTAIQALAVSGGVQASLATVELALAGVVLALGAGGLLETALLAATLAAAALATRRYLRARRAWTEQRLALTHELTEGMIGHATRLAQASLPELGDRDDRALVRYLHVSADVDRAARRLTVAVPLGWPVLAALGLAPVFVSGAPTTAGIATALGGVLFAADALNRLANGAARLADAAIAWGSVRELFAAATAAPDVAPPSLALAPPSPDAPALAARGIGFRHGGRGAPVLAGAELVIARGEHVLLDAPSGRGKSTLAAIVAGLRRPDAGLVLAAGLDRASVGAAGWRRRVAYAPQFHDNHVFEGSLLFNLLMGRAWPPAEADIALAQTLCVELGLGPLIDRMPSGLLEQVGETGWQLSHGERSRIFLARALLQRAELVILDESLAALDPDNLAIALRCIEARAPAALAIAHP